MSSKKRKIGEYNDKDDPDFNPGSSESDEEIEEDKEIANKDRLFLVSEAQLDLLFQDCRNCGKKMLDSSIKKLCKSSGGRVKVIATCDKCNTISRDWESQTILTKGARISEKDVEMVVESKINGIPTSQIVDWTKGLNLNALGITKFREIEQDYLYPGLEDFYLKGYIKNIRQYIKTKYGNKIKICGDGRFDSRGYSAKYCVYIVVEEQSNLIIAYYLAEKEQVENISGNMEPFAAKQCIQELLADGFEISHFCTDRSTSVKAMIEALNIELNLSIIHEYDVWHMVKSIMKELFKLSKSVKGKGIAVWLKSIRNQLWYAFSQAKGNVKRLYEYMDAIVYHITDNHRCRRKRIPTPGCVIQFIRKEYPELDKQNYVGFKAKRVSTKLFKLSPELAAVVEQIVGEKLSKPEIMKRLKLYIINNNLEQENKGGFIPDRVLSKVFGKSNVKYFGIAKYLTNHIF